MRRGRLHYIRPTKEEAYRTADSHHNNDNGQDLERTDGSRAMMTTVTAPFRTDRPICTLDGIKQEAEDIQCTEIQSDR